MNNSKLTKYNGKDILIKSKLKLKDYTQMLPWVFPVIFKFSLGNNNIFSHIDSSNLEESQKMMCQYIDVVENHLMRPITIQEMAEGYFNLLFMEFLEFNFGIFSQAKLLIKALNGKNSSGKNSLETEFNNKKIIIKSRLKMKDSVFADADGENKPFYMGCYGIGVGRTLATVVEKFADDNGIVSCD